MYTEKRPWGSFTTVVQNAKSLITVKVLKISPGQRTSLQRHSKRSETWLGMDGGGVAEVGMMKIKIEKRGLVNIPVGMVHRLSSEGGCEVVEISVGEFDENDETRIEDDYGRVR